MQLIKCEKSLFYHHNVVHTSTHANMHAHMHYSRSKCLCFLYPKYYVMPQEKADMLSRVCDFFYVLGLLDVIMNSDMHHLLVRNIEHNKFTGWIPASFSSIQNLKFVTSLKP